MNDSEEPLPSIGGQVGTALFASGAATAVTGRVERAEHARYSVQLHRLRRWTRRGQRQRAVPTQKQCVDAPQAHHLQIIDRHFRFDS